MNRFRLHSGHVLGAAAVLVIPAGIFGSKALAPLFAATVVLVVVANALNGRRRPLPSRPLAAVLAAIVAWSGVSWIWSPALELSARQTGFLAATSAGGLFLVAAARQMTVEERRTFATLMMVGIGAGLILVAHEVFSEAFLFAAFKRLTQGEEIVINYAVAGYYKTGTTVAAVVIWPALATAWHQGRGWRWLAAGVHGALALVLFRSGGGAGLLALAAGSAAFLASLLTRRHAALVFSVAMVLGVAAMPLVPPLLPEPAEIEIRHPNLPNSVFPRIFIWKTASRLIADSPLLGMGMNSARTISTSADKVPYSVIDGRLTRVSEPMPLHPHNAVLQVWLELGGVGAALLTLFLVMTVRAAAFGADAAGRAFSLASLTSALFVALVSYSLWSSWWQGTLWLTAAFMAAALPEPREATSKSPPRARTDP